MKHDNQPKKSPASSVDYDHQSVHAWRTWLLLSITLFLILTMVAILIVPRIIGSDTIKQKIQAVVAEQTGGIVNFQMIDFSYLPQPTIELRQVNLVLPEKAQVTAASLRIFPKVFSLLTGNLQLARLEFEKPQLSLELPESKTEVQPFLLDSLKKHLTSAFKLLSQPPPGLKLRFNNATITIAQNKQKIFGIDGMDLQFGMSVVDSLAGKANLQAKLSKLRVYPKSPEGNNSLQETIKNISLKCEVQQKHDRITITFDQLTAEKPSLELAGNLILDLTDTQTNKVYLSGSNIDVDAVRATALALAGESILVKEIFDYLRGGRVPQISFTSSGDNLLELGDLNNILIEGQLQDGKISISEIELDLTEVAGAVVIDKGILQGTGLSARLDDSTGYDGSLKIGITEGNNLFQLDLLLRADMTNVHSILQRIITHEIFIAELQKISNVQGAGHGRLILGDSLDDINVTVEVSELAISADFQRVPWPIKITKGQFAFSNNRIDLGMLSGTLGQSRFADFTSQLLWEEDLFLDISSGSFDLNMTELYPWASSLHDQLEQVQQITGQLHLSVLKFKGILDQPTDWDFTSTGTAKDLAVDTELFPETITFAGGAFTANTNQLIFEKFQTTGQDAELLMTGSLKGFPRQLNRIELSLDGSMGPSSVKWLSDLLEVPDNYAIHSPLSISDAKVTWQPDSTASFKGAITIEKGPAVTADIDYQPDQLQVHKLSVTDQYSDANLVFDLTEDQRNFEFRGKLQNETLQALFVDRHFSSGRVEGDFSITLPKNRLSEATAEGQLIGNNLPVLLPSGEIADIEQITLNGNADDSQIIADITKLTWKGLIWEPVKATVSYKDDQTEIKFIEAKLCGIDSRGTVFITGNLFSLNTTLEGKDLDVSTSYTCLTQGRVKMTGSLDFFSRITARGETDDLIEALQGPLEMTFSNGLIQQDKLLARTLEVLNVTEIVKGRLPDLNTTGLAYKNMTLQGEFDKGKLIINEFFMDGETLHLVGNGGIGLEEQTINVQLLAAPFKTIDSIVKNIPGINYLFAGNIVTIPVRITGSLTDPQVEVMAASAVGSNLFNLAERTIKAPFKLIDAIIPWGDQDEE
jgi:hypothetical protein